MVLSAEEVTMFFGENMVLDRVTCSIEDGDKIGIIGPNGGGKTTFLNVVTGNIEPSFGAVRLSRDAAVGYLRQNSGLSADNTVEEEVLSVFSQVMKAKEEMDEIAEELKTHHSEKLTTRYADLLTFFEAREGYTIDVKIKNILNGMGFGSVHKDTPVKSLSGGEKTRLAMAKLLLEQPDILVLDEPTNHLDFVTLRWLEDYLGSYKGALLVVSHDRYFLDKCVNTIWEIENKKLTAYKGNYSSYLTQKKERVKRQEKEYAAQQKEIKSMEDFVSRNMARASTSDMAKSRLKALERLDRIEKPQVYNRQAKLSFTYVREPVKDVLDVDGLLLSVGDGENKKSLVSNLSFHVMRGEKLAIIGGNGTGKTTLIRTLLRKIQMENGRIRWGDNVKIGYFRQEGEHLNPGNTVIEELWRRYPTMSQQDVRTDLGRVLITGNDVFKKVADLSGGERAKLSFAILMLEHPNVLVMDEPTNHLDLVSKEILELALCEYSGTMIFVSHDRFLLSKIPTSLLIIEDGEATRFEGNYSEYTSRYIPPKIQENRVDVDRKDIAYKSRDDRRIKARLRAEVKEMEEKIEKLDAEIMEINSDMENPDVFSDYEKMSTLCEQVHSKKQILEEIMTDWAEKSAILDEAE